MILSAAGGVDHDAIVAQATEIFGGLKPVGNSLLAPASFAGGERREEKELEQVHFALSFEAPGYRAPDVYTAQVYATAMGGGMSSRLFQKIREERGLCYSIFAQSGAYEDTGQVTVYAGTSAEEIGDLAALTVDELKRAADDMSEAEVARARAQLKAGLLMGLESPSSRGRTQCAAAGDLGPRARCGRGGGPDRRRDHRRRAHLCRRDGRREIGAGALRPGRQRPGDRGDPQRPRGLMLGLRRKVRVETERMTLRLPTHSDWRAMGGAAQCQCRLSDPVGAGLGQRPPDPPRLYQPGLLGRPRRGAGHGAAPAADPARGSGAAGRADAGQHPARTVAGGDAWLLDGRALCAAGLHARGDSGRHPPRLYQHGRQPARGCLPARKRGIARRAGKMRLQV